MLEVYGESKALRQLIRSLTFNRVFNQRLEILVRIPLFRNQLMQSARIAQRKLLCFLSSCPGFESSYGWLKEKELDIQSITFYLEKKTKT